MKNRKPLCAAAILSLALSIPALGGDIQTPTITTPPPPTTKPESLAASTVCNDTAQTVCVQQSTEPSSEDLLVSLILDMLLCY
jgi:hypothetical protein